jgi:hypothetical protein
VGRSAAAGPCDRRGHRDGPGDLVATGATVRIDGRVDGDLVAGAGQVIVAGTVTGDLLAGAGTTTISGQVDGDARVAGGQARRHGPVGEDAWSGSARPPSAPTPRSAGPARGRRASDHGRDGHRERAGLGRHLPPGRLGRRQRAGQSRPARGAQEPTVADRLLDILRR